MTTATPQDNLLFFYDNSDWAQVAFSLAKECTDESIDVTLTGDAEWTGDLNSACDTLWGRLRMDLRIPGRGGLPDEEPYPSEPGFCAGAFMHLQVCRFSFRSVRRESLRHDRDLGHVLYAFEAIKRPDGDFHNDPERQLLRNCRGFVADLDACRVRRLTMEEWGRYLARTDRSERLDGTDG